MPSHKMTKAAAAMAPLGLFLLFRDHRARFKSEERVRKPFLIRFNGKTIDGHALAQMHPGGAGLISSVPHGSDITQLMQHEALAFHFKNNIGFSQVLASSQVNPQAGYKPSADFEFHNLIDHPYLTACNQGVYSHDSYNIEFPFDPEGKALGFVRNHGPQVQRQFSYIDVRMINAGQKQLQLSDLQMSQTISAVKACAGAGRVKYPYQTNGIPWGSKGGEAIALQHYKVLPLQNVLNLTAKRGCLIRVTGADGYAAVFHSSELEKIYLSTGYADDTSFDADTGGAVRLIMPNAPGFRWIKDVVSIDAEPEPCLQHVETVLQQRLGDPCRHLEPIKRMLLAACPEYDAYLIRSDDKSHAFFLEHPLSTYAYEIKPAEHGYAVRGLTWGDGAGAAAVVWCTDTWFCSASPDPVVCGTTTNAEDGYYLWMMTIPYAVMQKSQGHLMSIHFNNNAEVSPGILPIHSRGLFYYQNFPQQLALLAQEDGSEISSITLTN